MPQPRYLMAATLLVLLTLAPMANWPLGHLAAYAQTTRDRSHSDGEARAAGDLDLLIVASSNENEREDREERRGRNQNDQDDNDDGDDWSPPPPPPNRGPANEPAPPAPPDQSAQCLGNGGTVTVSLPGGSATFKSYQDNLYAELARVDPGSVPSPGNLVGQLVLRLTASPCGGQAYSSLPCEANLGVSYSDDAASGRDEGKFTLMFFDGQRWSAAPKQANDAPHNYVSATISAPGVYALVQQ